MAVLFLAKYIVLGSARPHECFKAADAVFPPSHKKNVILSLPQHVSCPQGAQAAKP